MNKCDIIIPIYNAYDCLSPCIDSIIKNTDLKNNRIILIDDKSPDERVLPLLEEYSKKESIILLKNEKNLGFVGTVNKGMKYSENDVLLLNSDTEVTKNWLKNIQELAYSQPMVATVTAISNNATLASVPEGLKPNELPKNISLEEYGQLIEKISYNEPIEIPTAHGFCMFIRREALNDVGFFDEKTFGKGYGEENDFAYRCYDYGYKHLLCDKAFVVHKESQSFSDSRQKLVEEHEKILQDRYPLYKKRTELWCERFPIKKNCENINYQLKLHKRHNIMFLLHDWKDVENNVGGTTIHAYEIIKSLRSKFNFHVLAPENGVYKLYSYYKDSETITKFQGTDDVNLVSKYNYQYKEMVDSIVKAFRIDTIHIHHMIGHYMDIIDVAKENNIYSMITLHDFYSLCPSINMLYMMKKCCLEMDDIDCKKCLVNKMGINNNIIDAWRRDWKSFLSKFDKIITPSTNTKNYILKYYNNLKIDVIEHGINISKSNYYGSINEKQYNVGFVGVMAEHKGGKILEEMIAASNNPNIKFHLFGVGEYGNLKKSKKNYIYHGKYKKENLPKLLEENKINLVCSLSIWPETYSYTLTENIASGVPVLSFDIGAVGDRIKENEFGWVIPITDNSKEVLNKINNIFENVDDYNKKIENIKKYNIKTIEEMTSEYNKIYSNQKIKSLNEENAQKLRDILEEAYGVKETVSSAEMNWIINSLRWKLVSKIKVPNKFKKIIKKVLNK